jgi:predicted nucleic acid-binding protein
MNVYLDTSVVMRRLLRHPDSFTDWGKWERVFSSVLLRVESLRTLDRLRLEGHLSDAQRAELHRQFQIICDDTHFIGLTDDVLARASQPLPTVLGTLDALHLATALAVQQQEQVSLTLVTHDERLAMASQTTGLTVAGI